jgi:F0F1-type ATP synthase membrane subunit b/b'
MKGIIKKSYKPQVACQEVETARKEAESIILYAKKEAKDFLDGFAVQVAEELQEKKLYRKL